MHGVPGRRLRAGEVASPGAWSAAAVGFALPELMIVVVLLGVLAGIAYGAQVNALDRVRSVVARFYVGSQARACSYALVGDDVYVQTAAPSEMELEPSSSWSASCIRSARFPIAFTATWGGESWTATIGSGGQVSVSPAEAAIVGSSVAAAEASGATTPPSQDPQQPGSVAESPGNPACEKANGNAAENNPNCS